MSDKCGTTTSFKLTRRAFLSAAIAVSAVAALPKIAFARVRGRQKYRALQDFEIHGYSPGGGIGVPSKKFEAGQIFRQHELGLFPGDDGGGWPEWMIENGYAETV